MQKEQDFDVFHREMLAQGLEKMDLSRMTLNNQEAGEKETQQEEDRLSRSPRAPGSQHEAVLVSRNFSSTSR